MNEAPQIELLSPNRAHIFQHLEALFHPRYELPVDTWFEITNLVNTRHFAPTQLNEAADFALNLNKAGANVYVSPGLRRGKALGKNDRAKTGNFASSHWAWAEFDQEGDEQRVKAILDKAGLKPDTLVLTGVTPWPRCHFYFRLDKPVTSVEELKAANEGLQTLLKTDAVSDPIRVLRLAGTINYPPPHKVERGYIRELVQLSRPPAPEYTAAHLAGLGGNNGRDEHKKPRTPDEITELLEATRKDGEWHNNMLRAVASMVGQGWTDAQIWIAARGYRKDDQSDAQLAPMIKDAREKFDKPEPKQDARPTIKIKAGNIASIVDKAETALVAANRPIFERAKHLVFPITSTLPAADGLKTDVVTFKEMQTANMVYALNKYAANFVKWDARSKKFVPIDPPTNVAGILLAKGEWTFPVVTGLITTPTMRLDGTLLDKPGYDEKTQLWYQPDRQLEITPIKTEPTKEDALEALQLLIDLLSEFPFVTPLDKAVAIAGLMTPSLRGAFDVAPLTYIRAHIWGSGKTFLINLISRIITARPCPVIEEASNNEELGKRLDAAIFQGWQIICIDNCLFDIGGAKLSQITEQQIVGIRILGKTEVIPCEWRGSMFATGNNVGVTADMTRRTLYCNLDPRVDRPENRVFIGNPVDMVLADRWKYIKAILTISRAWRVNGSPIAKETPPFASFEQWAKAVRHPLIWLGMEDPVKSMEEVREEDPERNAAQTLLSLARSLFKVKGSDHSAIFDAGELIKNSQYSHQDSDDVKLEREALDLVLRSRCDGNVTGIKIGMWLKSIKGQVHNGYCLELMKETNRAAARYRVEKVKEGDTKRKTEEKISQDKLL